MKQKLTKIIALPNVVKREEIVSCKPFSFMDKECSISCEPFIERVANLLCRNRF